jgi:hypothetical protein
VPEAFSEACSAGREGRVAGLFFFFNIEKIF